MANLNKVMLIGRLTRDPEVRTFPNGGKVAKIGFAVNNRKKNQQTGQWEDVPVFIDVDAFNREQGRKLADLVEQYLRKGHQVYIEGSLVLDQWTSQDGQKRSKLKVVVNDLQFLEPRKDGGSGESTGPSVHKPASYPAATGFDEPEADGGGAPEAPEGDIPF
jgi:single-strand DNA-binding protein